MTNRDQASKFLDKSGVKASDLDHRRKINYNIGKYNAVVPQGKQQFDNIHLARERAKNIKWRSLESLDQQLERFEQAFTRRGGKIIWAEDGPGALREILAICKAKSCSHIVKSKSMVTEEIHLNSFMQENGIEILETDLGEYIQQLDGEPPYHIVTPAMHKSKEDIARLFHEKLQTAPGLSPAELTLIARQKMRAKYPKAAIGITGANFIIADTGSIALTENEGNGRLCASYPATHIVITGIEKIIPSLTDLALFWPLLATFGTGQRVTSYNSIISGARQPGEYDGPVEMYVILLDNGRSNMLANTKLRESLYCIRCGACLNACPVYKNIGGHSYGTTYSGPIGAVITPHLKDLGDWKHLSYASSLCGNCTEVCAVKINLHEILLENRHEAVQEGSAGWMEKMAWKGWKTASLQRKWMNMGNAKIKNWFINRVFRGWNRQRADLHFPEKSFNQRWVEKHKS
jgi:L-lactate dehydrogenase complex protein LldF